MNIARELARERSAESKLERDVFLERERARGQELAQALVEHVRLMQAGSVCMPVDDYEVSVTLIDSKGRAAGSTG